MAFDLESEDDYSRFIATHRLPPDCTLVKTGRGYHIWAKPKKPIRSQRVDGVEIKCLGSYVLAPPSVHPSGSSYVFIVAPNGSLPEVDIEAVLGLSTQETSPEVDAAAGAAASTAASAAASAAAGAATSSPSDFAMRYGRSPYTQSLCGRATKVLTRSDGKVKKLSKSAVLEMALPKVCPIAPALLAE